MCLHAGLRPLVLAGDDEHDTGKDDHCKDAPEDTGREHVRNGAADECAVNDHDDARRDDGAETARHGHETGGLRFGVFNLLHGRIDHRADGDGRGRAAAGERGEERAGENGRIGQTAADAAGENVGKVHDFAVDAAGGHQVAGENEQRDGHERERVHARVQALCDRDDGNTAVKKS